MIDSFEYLPVPIPIWFGQDRLDAIPQLFADHVENILIVCGGSVAQTPLPSRVATILDKQYVDTWTGVEPHVPITTVMALASYIETKSIEGLISIGGGVLSIPVKRRKW